jgi:hypothetical protein
MASLPRLPRLKEAILKGDAQGVVDVIVGDRFGIMFFKESDLEPGLLLACRKGHANIVKTLVERCGLDLNTLVSNNGTSPLMYACEYGHLNVVKYILEKYNLGKWLNVNYVRPSDGMTALMLASLNGNMEIVKALLKKGAKIDAKRQNGKNSLNIAGDGNHRDLAKFLVDQGAKMSDYFKEKYLQLLEEAAAEPEPTPTPPPPPPPPAVEEVGPESAGCFGAWCTPSRTKVAPSPSGGKTRRRKLRKNRRSRHHK